MQNSITLIKIILMEVLIYMLSQQSAQLLILVILFTLFIGIVDFLRLRMLQFQFTMLYNEGRVIPQIGNYCGLNRSTRKVTQLQLNYYKVNIILIIQRNKQSLQISIDLGFHLTLGLFDTLLSQLYTLSFYYFPVNGRKYRQS